MKLGHPLRRVAPALLGLGLTACALFLRREAAEDRPPYVTFSHARHVPAGASPRTCVPCHSQPDTFEQVPSSGHGSCASCHAIGDRPGPTCDLCHTSSSPGQPPVRPRKSFLFTHTSHRWMILDATTCRPCHEVSRSQAEVRTVVSEEACVSCHRAQGAAVECATCHVALSRATVPDSHARPSFMREHDEMADATCLRCHARSFCDGCHTRDHTPLWKRATHGIDAIADPRACASCHEADQCVRCHSTVRPTDHVQAGWAGAGHAMPARASPRACLTCHDPADECARCHER